MNGHIRQTSSHKELPIHVGQTEVHQTALDGGNRENSWMLLPIQDPLGKDRFGGTEEELESVAGYRTALRNLQKNTRLGGPANANFREDSLEDEKEAQPKHRGKAKGKKND